MTAATLPARAEVVRSEGVVSGAVLRCFRCSLRVHQQEFCDRLLVDINTYRSWENGRRPLGHLPVVKFRVFCRALVEAGVPVSLIGALDVAVDVDLDVARALASGENIFPPAGVSETWRALLHWTLGGPAPVMFSGLRAEPPRICPRDQRILTARAGWELGG